MTKEPSSRASQTGGLSALSPSWQFIALGVLAAGIMTLGLVPGFAHPIGDKAEHVLAFAVLALACRLSTTVLARPLVCFGVLVAAAIGLEVVQGLFVHSRVASKADALASCMGIAAGMAASWVRGGKLAAAIAGIVVLALATNWTLNTGRYKVQDMLMSGAASATLDGSSRA